MKEKINVTKVLLFLVILSVENFCCLVPSTSYLIPNLFKYSDLGLIFAVIFFLWVMLFVKFKEEGRRAHYPYKWIVLFFFVIIVISSAMANHFFAQPVSWGIRSHRQIVVCFLLYFPISKALQTGVIKKEDVIKDIIIVATLEMLLYTIQYFLINKVVFLHFTYSDKIEMRLGTRRLRYPIELPIFSTFLILNKFLNKKGNSLSKIGYILWFAVILIVMVQKRTQIISFLFSVATIFVLWKKSVGTKLLINLLVFTVLIGFMLSSSIVQSAIEGIANRGSREDTLTIREKGIEYYKERVKESPIFGFGFPNSNCNDALIASGVPNGYYLADDGIYGFYYIFGLCGIIWLLIFWIKNIKLSFMVYKERNYVFLLYFIYETVELYIGMKWYYYWYLAMVLAITLLSNESVERNMVRGLHNE